MIRGQWQLFDIRASKDPILSSAFQEYLREINICQVRVYCVLAFTLVPLFGLLDYFTVSDHFGVFLRIRAVCTLSLFFLFLLSFTATGKRHINILGAMAPLLVGGVISLMVRFLGGYESSYYAGLNLVMLGVAMLYAWQVKITAAICFIIYGLYIVPIILYDKIDHPGILVNNNAFLLSTIVVALTSAYFLLQMRYQEFESRYKMEESRRALEISNQKLKELGEMKGQFFADISHELRTPLAVIRGEAEVTLRGKDKPILEYKKVLGYIITLVEQLNKLVGDLLFLARSESGTIQIEKREVSLEKVLHEAYREGETLAAKKKISVSFKNSQERELAVQGDPQRLRQLFLIVIDNAINYSDTGGEVSVALDQDGNQGRIVISDRGVGIPEESLPLVFERFYRVEKSKVMSHGGAGLGLAIAKWIVEAHHGNISVQSRVGSGTNVTITLPVEGEKTGADSLS